jgi:type II secretory pathway pseudopilin PulG
VTFVVSTRLARAGFTFTELLVVTFIGVILLSIFVPYALSWRESNRRTKCQDNLRQIGRALAEYAKGNDYNYPRVRYDAENNPNGWTAFTGPDAANPFAADSAVQPNDVTASLWLLLRTGMVNDAAVFVCPASGDRADAMIDAGNRKVDAAKRGNFRRPGNLSYSYASPFSSAPAYRLNDTLPGRFVVMADKNPGLPATQVRPTDAPDVLAKGNSPNHDGAGQMVLYADGSVWWLPHPFVGGEKGDNIFTALKATPIVAGDVSAPPASDPGVLSRDVGPSYNHDSYLVPTADDAALPTTPRAPVTKATTEPANTPPAPTPPPAAAPASPGTSPTTSPG